jgi:hypothetical protein
VLELARSRFDEREVLGQERPAESRVCMPLARHEHMSACALGQAALGAAHLDARFD